jgi:DNA-binding MarR family transcriptional regulator
VRAELREYLGAADAFDEAMAERLGIGRTDMRCVDIIQRRGTMSAGALAQASGLSTGAVTFLLDRLERHHLVRRRPDPTDRRRVMVELVPAAARRAFKLHEPMITEMRALIARYGTEELALVREFLHDARQAYEEALPQHAQHREPETDT